MALQDIAQVNITLETSAVTSVGFSTPLFISSHRYFTERVRSYTSLVELAEDFPTTSNAYIASQGLLAQSGAPAQFKIGRREVDSIEFALDGDPNVAGTVYAITVTDSSGTATVTVTTDVTTNTAAEVVTALKAGLSALTDVADSGTTTLILTKGTDEFTISGVTGLTGTNTVTETAADCMTAIQAVDDDFYYIGADDHTQAFILALAADVEAKNKIYFFSVDEADGITALTEPAANGDTLGKVAELDYFRTVGLFHHDADTLFPEMRYIGVGAGKQPGTMTWANQKVAGLDVSQDPSTGLNLSTTQKNNLSDRNASLVVSLGGITAFRDGKVASGEWIDVISSRDLLIARITEGYENKILNSEKITYDDNGIREMQNVLESVLSRYVSTASSPNILQAENPFTVTVPRSKDVSFATKQSRILNLAFEAYLAGSIHIAVVSGTLTYDATA